MIDAGLRPDAGFTLKGFSVPFSCYKGTAKTLHMKQQLPVYQSFISLLIVLFSTFFQHFEKRFHALDRMRGTAVGVAVAGAMLGAYPLKFIPEITVGLDCHIGGYQLARSYGSMTAGSGFLAKMNSFHWSLV